MQKAPDVGSLPIGHIWKIIKLIKNHWNSYISIFSKKSKKIYVCLHVLSILSKLSNFVQSNPKCPKLSKIVQNVQNVQIVCNMTNTNFRAKITRITNIAVKNFYLWFENLFSFSKAEERVKNEWILCAECISFQVHFFIQSGFELRSCIVYHVSQLFENHPKKIVKSKNNFFFLL